MEIQIMKDFLNMQMDTVEQTENRSEAGATLLLMADYLLEALEKRPEIFAEANEQQLRMLFLRCGKSGERLRSFYEQYKKPLEESATAILKRIQSTNEVIAQHKQSVDDLEKDNQELLERQEELQAVKRQLEELDQSIKECKKIQEDAKLLSEKIAEAGELREELAAEYKENERIINAIEKDGFFEKDDFIRHLEQLKKQGNEVLESYDKAIENILEDAVNMYDRIKERQRMK